MASLDNLPADQRAVLSLVLERGRGYDEIARMLSIDRTAVRERALVALDALGPPTQISDLRRALITDYLLGQLPPIIAHETRDRLATNPGGRAWARVLASELAPLASRPLPEIPPASTGDDTQPSSAAATVPSPAPAAATVQTEPDAATTASGPTAPDRDSPRSSRLGGMIVLVGAAVVAIAVVLVIVLSSGGSSKSPDSPSVAASASGATGGPASVAGASTTTGPASSTPQVVAQINLLPPAGSGKAAGVAEVLKQGANRGIAIVAQNMPANTRTPPNAYAVWLYNSAADAKLLGFVNPGVGQNGRLSTAGRLPTNASHFSKLIITLETKADPKTPGTIVLSGALSGV